jgi:hypothetical protein
MDLLSAMSSPASSRPTFDGNTLMAVLGKLAEPSSATTVLGDARTRASAIPDLLVEAQRIAATVASGWHGRKMRGSGENFWQFRPHTNGEPAQMIDWRRSARDDSSYVREKEWDAAHTVWLWADASPSMQFQSTLARSSKADRALLIVLALAELLSRSGERIAWPNLANPFSARDGATRLAMRLAVSPQSIEVPDFTSAKRFSEIVIASDFSEPAEDVLARLDPLFGRGLRGHWWKSPIPSRKTFPIPGTPNSVIRRPAHAFLQDEPKASPLRTRPPLSPVAKHCRQPCAGVAGLMPSAAPAIRQHRSSSSCTRPSPSPARH